MSEPSSTEAAPALTSEDEPSLGERLSAAIPGELWILGAVCCYSATAIMVCRLVRAGESIYWVGWLRFIFALIVMLAFTVGRVKVVNRSIFVWRGAIGSLGQFLMFTAVAWVGLGRGSVLVYLLGVVSLVAGIPLLGERPGPRVLGAVLLATIGVFGACGARWPQGAEWLALGGALCSGVAVVLVRLLRRTDGNRVSLLSQSLFGALLLTGPALIGGHAPSTPAAWGTILLLSLSDGTGQLCQSQGLARVSAARGGALFMLTPILGLLWGVAVEGEMLSPLNWLGCGLALAASLLAAMR